MTLTRLNICITSYITIEQGSSLHRIKKCKDVVKTVERTGLCLIMTLKVMFGNAGMLLCYYFIFIYILGFVFRH